MNKAIRNALNKRRIGCAPALRRYIVTGTVRTRDGGTDLDHSDEYAVSLGAAWIQAVDHAAGTDFTPEKVEEV